MVLLAYGWHAGNTIILGHTSILLSYCHTLILLPYRHTTVLSYYCYTIYHTVTLLVSYCHTTAMLSYSAILSYCCYILSYFVQLSYCHTTTAILPYRHTNVILPLSHFHTAILLSYWYEGMCQNCNAVLNSHVIVPQARDMLQQSVYHTLSYHYIILLFYPCALSLVTCC